MSGWIVIGAVALLGHSETEPLDREASLAAMQRRAAQATVTLASERRLAARRVEKPLFRYVDEQRKIADATVWAWEIDGRPIALQKVEFYPGNPADRQWLYCFAVLSATEVIANWPGEKPFQSKPEALVFQTLPKAPRPASTAPGRMAQLRQAARRFSATILRDTTTGQRDVMRLIDTPLHRYASPNQKILDGAVFGLTATGTNPDAFLLVEIEQTAGGPVWNYASGRMTLEGLAISLDDEVVWKCNHLHVGTTFDSWLYFYPR